MIFGYDSEEGEVLCRITYFYKNNSDISGRRAGPGNVLESQVAAQEGT